MPESGSMPQKNISMKACQLVKYLTAEKQSKSTTIQDKTWTFLTREQEILMNIVLFAYRYQMKSIILPQVILREEEEAAVKALTTVVSSGVDTTPQN